MSGRWRARRRYGAGSGRRAGFTLIELLVVFVIIGLLLSIAVPRYQNSVQRSKEAVLRQNLATAREAIDRFFADRGRYPDALDDLVREGYLRTLPNDPLTESSTAWVIVPPRDSTSPGRVYDIRSTAEGVARDATRYEDW
ncbi:MAG: prepilin-type N-terminal cleavage/methylation domain-containing protein [Proteobacteria bacterium]|nr:prepilin-type N-terminal cleavage/methylation domain-containing protein [Burkholderiales bacterium]